MHDDDDLMWRNENAGTGSYWNEAEWEAHLLEAERLMDRYEEIIEKEPRRTWEDPMDLYMKATHGIDLGVEFVPKERKWAAQVEDEDEEDFFEEIGEGGECTGTESGPEGCEGSEGLSGVMVYNNAFQFSVAVHEWLRQGSGAMKKDVQVQEFSQHVFKIAADIAGGHGLGYQEEGLCGNIVKNRWALKHVAAARALLPELIKRFPRQKKIHTFIQTCAALEDEIGLRVEALRQKVWWHSDSSS